MKHPTAERGFTTTTDRIPLFYRLEPASAEAGASGAVLLLHGYGEHSGRYTHVLAGLTAAGFDCLALDFRGHGQSGGQRGHVLQYDDYLDDVATGVTLLRARRPDLPMLLLGHSQGGLITLLYLAERMPDVAGAVVVSPMLGLGPVPRWKAAAGYALSRFVPGLALSNGLNAAHLCRDPEIVRAYRTDSLVHHVATARWFTEARAAQERVFRRAGEIRHPVLLLQAGDDRIVSAEATRRFFGRLALSDKALHVYDAHFHELLNEPDGEEILARIVGWLEHRTRS